MELIEEKNVPNSIQLISLFSQCWFVSAQQAELEIKLMHSGQGLR